MQIGSHLFEALERASLTIVLAEASLGPVFPRAYAVDEEWCVLLVAEMRAFPVDIVLGEMNILLEVGDDPSRCVVLPLQFVWMESRVELGEAGKIAGEDPKEVPAVLPSIPVLWRPEL